MIQPYDPKRDNKPRKPVPLEPLAQTIDIVGYSGCVIVVVELALALIAVWSHWS